MQIFDERSEQQFSQHHFGTVVFTNTVFLVFLDKIVPRKFLTNVSSDSFLSSISLGLLLVALFSARFSQFYVMDLFDERFERQFSGQHFGTVFSNTVSY